jgi:hypothetical protein
MTESCPIWATELLDEPNIGVGEDSDSDDWPFPLLLSRRSHDSGGSNPRSLLIYCHSYKDQGRTTLADMLMR